MTESSPFALVPASFGIRKVECQRFDLELNEPFAIAGGSHELCSIAVARVTLTDGTHGLGEAAPLPAYNGETIERVERTLALAAPLLAERSYEGWDAAAEVLASLTKGSGAARCALEMALLDALARRAGVRLTSFFGAAAGPALETDVTIPIGSVEHGQRSADRWSRSGFRTLKIKVGDERTDLDRVVAIHFAAPAARLVLDANAGLDGKGARRLMDELAQRRINVALFEQPVPRGDWAGLRHVAESGVRLALDESAVTAEDVAEIAHELGTRHVVNVKLMKAGVREAWRVANAARAHGLGLMIGGMVETSLAMTVSACFAVGLGGFEFVDLDTPLFLRDSPFEGGFRYRGATLDLSAIELGHGVTLRRTARASDPVP